MPEKTRNETAWEQLFDKYKILERIQEQGFFEIKSVQINEIRESRLMAKFDHYVNLPKIFRDNSLSILPLSRSKYVIGHFDTHLTVKSSHVDYIAFELPISLESIDSTNLYSESAALSYAFNAGIIDDLFSEKVFYTVSGRMSTNVFNFSIGNTIKNSLYNLTVENSQCEIDGGFESENYFLIIEAKNYSVDDFLVRQLYYPYRLWKNKVSKQVIPILMTYSGDVFSFFIYKFEDDSNYNSLSLIEQRNYITAPESIQLDDISNIFDQLVLIPEPNNIPFPQANNFERVVDLLSILAVRDLTKDEITENYQFDIRQTHYYTDAGRYLGLVDRYKDSSSKEVTFCLTQEGRSLLKRRHKSKFLLLIKKILQHRTFYDVFKFCIDTGEIPSQEGICEIMSTNDLGINHTTIKRRSSTVRGWINWIWEQIE